MPLIPPRTTVLAVISVLAICGAAPTPPAPPALPTPVAPGAAPGGPQELPRWAVEGRAAVIAFFDMLEAGDVERALFHSLGPPDEARRSMLEAWSASGRAHAELDAAVGAAFGEDLAWPPYALPADETVAPAVGVGRGVLSVTVATMPEPLKVYRLGNDKIDLTPRLRALRDAGGLDAWVRRHHAAADALAEARVKLAAGEFAEAEAVRVYLDETVPLEGGGDAEPDPPTTQPVEPE